MATKDKDQKQSHASAPQGNKAMAQPTSTGGMRPWARTEHPFRRFREEMDTLFNRFFGGWGDLGESIGRMALRSRKNHHDG